MLSAMKRSAPGGSPCWWLLRLLLLSVWGSTADARRGKKKTCPGKSIAHSNHAVGSPCVGANSGDACEVSCSAGYAGGGTITCGAGGSFTPSVACEATLCSETKFPHSDKKTAGCTGSTGATCSVECDSGYTGGGLSTCTDSHVAGDPFSALVCAPKSCGKLQRPAHASGCTKANYKYAAKNCELTCEAGYSIGGTISGDTTQAVSCLATGLFSATVACEPIPCTSKLVPHSNYANAPCSGHTEQTCTVRCDAGFTAGLPDTLVATAELMCLADTHLFTTATCTPHLCPAVDVPDHASGCSSPLHSRSSHVEDPCTISCSRGFTTNGHSGGPTTQIITCGDDGENTAITKCKPVVCPTLVPSPHSSGTMAGGSDVLCPGLKHFSETCTAHCRTGYTTTVDAGGRGQPEGSTEQTFSCGPDGRFNDTVVEQCVAVGCGQPPTPLHSSWAKACDGKVLVYLETCDATCDEGYTKGTRAESFQCDATGGFSEELNCQTVECPAALPAQNVEVYPSVYETDVTVHADVSNCTSNTKTYAETCEVSCNSGYTRSTLGQFRTSFTCKAHQSQAVGYWDGKIACQAVDCQLYPDRALPAHTEKTSCTGRYYLQTCDVRCVASYYYDDRRQPVRYTCKAPVVPGPAGQWLVTSSKPSDPTTPTSQKWACIAGTLTPGRSGLTHIRETTPTLDYRGGIYTDRPDQNLGYALIGKGLPERDSRKPTGYQLAAEKGPRFELQVRAADQFGNLRNYPNLCGDCAQEVDYVTAFIQRASPSRVCPRMPLDMAPGRISSDPQYTGQDEHACLASQDEPLQPTGEDGATGYQGAMGFRLSSTNTEEISHAQDNIWRIKHQFQEYGVFYISVYICAIGDKKECDEKNEANRVPSNITTFTVCPQGTGKNSDDRNEDGVVLGSFLHKCKANEGYFSPRGWGYAAQRCEDGFSCVHKGTTWPVAQPGYWVSATMPVTMSRCGNKQACPGSIVFGANCSAGDGVVDFDSVPTGGLGSRPCFSQIPKAISVERIQGSGYMPYLEAACYDVTGHRCCAGSFGKKCESCCHSETSRSKNPSCDGAEWHSVGSSEGAFCAPCPSDGPGGAVFVLIGGLLSLFLAPILMKASQIAHHAQGLQAPVLSVINFFQSADLFLGLGLHWPEAFKVFCRKIAGLFNFNIVGILRMLKIPPVDCAWHLTYKQKWLLIQSSPIMLFALVMLLTAIQVVALIAHNHCHAAYRRRGFQVRCSACVNSFTCCRKKERAADNGRFGSSLYALTPAGVVINTDASSLLGTLRGRPNAAVPADWSATTTGSIKQRSGLALSTVQSAGLVSFRGLTKHDWATTLSSAQRLTLVYLMVGYIFLAGTALEPLSCSQDLDGKKYMEAAQDIQCDMCEAEYRLLAAAAVVCFTLYGFGTPLLFYVILYRHRAELKSQGFMRRFGFLSTKMRDEHWEWEVFISLRKLALVLATRLSDRAEIPCALINLFVTVMAFGAQVYTLPFANEDANTAETLTLLSTLLVLVLGLGQHKAEAENIDSEHLNAAFSLFNTAVYSSMAVFVLASIFILLRRSHSAVFSFIHRKELKAAQADDRVLSDQVRNCLHKSKLEPAVAWASVSATAAELERVEAVFAGVKAFEAETEIRQSKQWQQYFPVTLRPCMYSWLVSAEPDAVAELQWFLGELAEMERQQLQLSRPRLLSRESNTGASSVSKRRASARRRGPPPLPVSSRTAVELLDPADLRQSQAFALHNKRAEDARVEQAVEHHPLQRLRQKFDGLLDTIAVRPLQWVSVGGLSFAITLFCFIEFMANSAGCDGSDGGGLIQWKWPIFVFVYMGLLGMGAMLAREYRKDIPEAEAGLNMHAAAESDAQEPEALARGGQYGWHAEPSVVFKP